MLVLSRKKDEKIILSIGDVEVVVVVCAIKDNRIRIGFDAPEGVRIRREEHAEKSKESQE